MCKENLENSSKCYWLIVFNKKIVQVTMKILNNRAFLITLSSIGTRPGCLEVFLPDTFAGISELQQHGKE